MSNGTILITGCILILLVGMAGAATVNVSHEEGSDFLSIQDAIDNASAGDTILLKGGTFTEAIIVDKPLKIKSISSNPEDVKIVSDNLSIPVIHVLADNVEIKGLTILGIKNDSNIAGIFLDNVDNSSIQNNIISNAYDGLLIDSSYGSSIRDNTFSYNSMHGANISGSGNNTLMNNQITKNQYGLYLDISDQNILSNNNVSNNEKYGIGLRKSNLNSINGNYFISNKYGLTLTDSNNNRITGNLANGNNQSGFLLWDGNSNIIKNNILENNKDSGIYFLLSCSNNTLNGNTFSGNQNGISIEYSNDNFFINNTFSSNKDYGVYYIFAGNENIFTDNTYEDNKEKNIKISFIQTIILRILTILSIAAFALYFNIGWLKKALLALGVLALIVFILTLAWHFPFEAGMTENVEITNMQWTDSLPINETHTRGNLSFDLIYVDKEHPRGLEKTIPVEVHISSRSTLYEDYEPVYKGPLNLEYMEEYHYSQSLALIGEKPVILVRLYTEVFFDYPNPIYGDSRIEDLGMEVVDSIKTDSDLGTD